MGTKDHAGKVEHFAGARFMCKARWRCTRCDSPWFSSFSFDRAWKLLLAHWRGCRP